MPKTYQKLERLDLYEQLTHTTFARMPRALLQRLGEVEPRLKPLDRLILVTLFNGINEKYGTCAFPSVGTLKKWNGAGQRSVESSLARVTRFNLVKVKKQGRGRSYDLSPLMERLVALPARKEAEPEEPEPEEPEPEQPEPEEPEPEEPEPEEPEPEEPEPEEPEPEEPEPEEPEPEEPEPEEPEPEEPEPEEPEPEEPEPEEPEPEEPQPEEPEPEEPEPDEPEPSEPVAAAPAVAPVSAPVVEPVTAAAAVEAAPKPAVVSPALPIEDFMSDFFGAFGYRTAATDARFEPPKASPTNESFSNEHSVGSTVFIREDEGEPVVLAASQQTEEVTGTTPEPPPDLMVTEPEPVAHSSEPSRRPPAEGLNMETLREAVADAERSPLDPRPRSREEREAHEAWSRDREARAQADLDRRYPPPRPLPADGIGHRYKGYVDLSDNNKEAAQS